MRARGEKRVSLGVVKLGILRLRLSRGLDARRCRLHRRRSIMPWWRRGSYATRTFHINEKVWLYNSCLKLFPGKLRSRWDSPYVVVESFENGFVLISNPKSGKQFKVNKHLHKPYLTTEPPTPANKVNLHLPEVRGHDNGNTLISSIILASLSFVWLKTLNFALLGGTPRLSYCFILIFLYFLLMYIHS